MMIHGTRMGAQIVAWGDCVEFYAMSKDGDKRLCARPVVFDVHAAGIAPEPMLRLTMDAAQEFFEQLWAQGFRSKHDRGGSDRLDAARAEHIADLRKAAKLA